jgi:FkbM family methyltransferase
MPKQPPLSYRIAHLLGNQLWLRWGLRYKFFALLQPSDTLFSVPFYGQIYTGNLNNFIDRVVYIFGAHERQIMEYTGSLLTKDSVVLDIGANVGHHSLFYSSFVKEVHAFEPYPEFFTQFNALMAENHISNVTLHPFGLGDKTEEAPYYAPNGDNHGSGSFVEGHTGTGNAIGTMKIVNGDDAIRQLSLTRIDFIKIDVEQYEETVLKGLQETFAKFKPIIVMEYAPGDFSSDESFFELTAKFKPALLRTNTSVLFFFNDPSCKIQTFDPKRGHGEVLLTPIP